jgi:hypothetical protein
VLESFARRRNVELCPGIRIEEVYERVAGFEIDIGQRPIIFLFVGGPRRRQEVTRDVVYNLIYANTKFKGDLGVGTVCGSQIVGLELVVV